MLPAKGFDTSPCLGIPWTATTPIKAQPGKPGAAKLRVLASFLDGCAEELEGPKTAELPNGCFRGVAGKRPIIRRSWPSS